MLVYDIAGRGFTRFRGAIGVENARTDIGSTLNPRCASTSSTPSRTWIACCRRRPARRCRRRRRVTTVDAAVDRVFRYALGRAPRPAERRAGRAARCDPANAGTRPSPEGLADLLWAVLMKPEFQFILD